MAGFVEQVLGLSECSRISVGLLELVKDFLCVEDSLIRFALRFGKEAFPLLQCGVESLAMAVYAGVADHLFSEPRRVERRLTFLSPSMTSDTIHVG